MHIYMCRLILSPFMYAYSLWSTYTNFPSFDFEDTDQNPPTSTQHNNSVRDLTTPHHNHLILTKKWISKPGDGNGMEPRRDGFTRCIGLGYLC